MQLGVTPRLSAVCFALGGPPMSKADVVPSEAEIIDRIDALLVDGRQDRTRMAALTGAFTLGAGLLGVTLGTLGSVPLVLAGAGLAAIVGGGLGIHDARKYLEGRKQLSSMTATAAVGMLGTLAGSVVAATGGPLAGVVATAGIALLSAVVGSAFRSHRLERTRADVAGLERRLEQATEMEAMVLRNLEAQRKAAEPGNGVAVSDDCIVIGGLRVAREKERPS